MTQRREPIRSAKLREAARGEECTLQIFGCCVGGTETTVLAHLHDETFGFGEKADDTSAVFACFGCHDEIDGRTRKTNGADLTWYKLRALQRTIRRLVERGIMSVKLDAPKPFAERTVKPRPPKSERAKIIGRSEIHSAGFDKTRTRKFNGTTGPSAASRRSERNE